MKKAILTLVIIFTFSISIVSCTTDAYDSEIDQNNISVDSDDLEETVETDPVIIPKKD
ncbi:exported hypothetical protein [Flavobacterium sp. 9AF]|uniref:hypothetical protein n=1 Tax=Flavobacterium sp. 9AF TaxID=2653142 RepID=UPI0012F269F0|nr:hypothetical protein [Flavobacterium sp. 9AF]VXB81970.1 exported hypothetical protein [Flavobacterium sp. 9AF]